MLKLWLIGNRTSCRPIQSVIILVIKQIGLPLRGRPILLITSMIIDRIGLHSVLLPLLIIIIVIIIIMKCPYTSHVEGDQFLNSQHAWACWDMVARGILFEIPRLTVKCTLSLTKWIDNLLRYQWIPNSSQNVVYWTQTT